jgi:hypothetical protein
MTGSDRLGSVAALGCVFVWLLAIAAPAFAAEDAATPMLQPYAIDVIDLQLPPESFETLEEKPEDDYVEGFFSLAESDGTPAGADSFSVPLKVGIRLKGGNGSFRDLKDEKAAFKIKFNEFVKGQKFLGLKKLTLNNMVQDPSMLHETMAYEAFRALGVPAPRTGYANVYVNGVNYGVHLNVETYDDISLPHLFASTQHLYEADEPGVDVRPGGQSEFEVDEGDDEDLGDLEALIAAANSGVGDWSDGMAGVADLEEMARMWAIERYIGHWDGYAGVALPHVPPVRPNNYYLHSDDAGLFSMLPWGTDQTWGLDVEFDEPAGGMLFNECFADESCEASYVDSLRDAQGAIGGLELDVQASCLADRLAPWQALEDEGRREFDAEEIAEGVEDAEDFIAKRPQELTDFLATQPGEGEGSAAGVPAPCGPPAPSPGPPPSGPAGSSSIASPPSSRSARRVALRHLDVGRHRLKAEVFTGGPGLVTVTAKMPTRNGGHRVCRARLQVSQAGTWSLSCALAHAARRRLRHRELDLHVVVGLTPPGGERKTIWDDITVPGPHRP